MSDLRRSRNLLASMLRVLGVGLLLAACSSPPPPPPPAPPAPQMKLTFWARSDRATAPGAIAGSNACGRTLTVSGNRVPQNDAAIEPAKVKQIDANAKIVRSWAVPINLIPVAVDGAKLLLQRDGGGDPLLEIGADGTVAEKSLPQLSRPKPQACPARPAAQYAPDTLCVSAVDIASGKKLMLEFDEVCR